MAIFIGSIIGLGGLIVVAKSLVTVSDHTRDDLEQLSWIATYNDQKNENIEK